MTLRHTGQAATHRSHRTTIVLIVAVALAVAVHLGLGGLLFANSQWTGAGADIVLAIVLVKVLVIGLSRFAIIRRGKAGPERRSAPEAKAPVPPTYPS